MMVPSLYRKPQLAVFAGALGLWVLPLCAMAEVCEMVAEPVQFCFIPGEWSPIDDQQSDTAASYVGDTQTLAQFSVNTGGSQDGQTPDSLVQAFITIRSEILPLDGPPVALSAAVDGQPGQTVVYAVTDGDETDITQTTIVVTPAYTLHFATTAPENADAAISGASHTRFLSQIRIF